MLTGRRSGGTPDRSAPPRTTRPALGVSNPAKSRINVVLPQPDGPSRQKNSRSKMSSVTSSTAAAAAKRLVTLSKRTRGTAPGSVHGAKERRADPTGERAGWARAFKAAEVAITRQAAATPSSPAAPPTRQRPSRRPPEEAEQRRGRRTVRSSLYKPAENPPRAQM